jgi:glycosyltransferase involved in cell wall biosynthesis
MGAIAQDGRDHFPSEGSGGGPQSAGPGENANSVGARRSEPGRVTGFDGSTGGCSPRRGVPAIHPDVRALYELLDLVLLPSRIEGLSQALLEAMALGKPVIASAAAGNADLITDGRNGRLVEPLDPAAWASAIEELLGDSVTATRLGAAASLTARNDYSLQHTIERTATLYRSILSQMAG